MSTIRPTTDALLTQIERLVLEKEEILDDVASKATKEIADAAERLTKLNLKTNPSCSKTIWVGHEEDSFPIEAMLYFDHLTGKFMFLFDGDGAEFVLGLNRERRIDIAKEYLPDLLAKLINALVTEIEEI